MEAVVLVTGTITTKRQIVDDEAAAPCSLQIPIFHNFAAGRSGFNIRVVDSVSRTGLLRSSWSFGGGASVVSAPASGRLADDVLIEFDSGFLRGVQRMPASSAVTSSGSVDSA